MGKVATRAATKAARAARASLEARAAKKALKGQQRKIVKTILSEPHVILHDLSFIKWIIKYYLENKSLTLKYGDYYVPINTIRRVFHFTSTYSNDNNFIIEFNNKIVII